MSILKDSLKRREFIGSVSALGAASIFSNSPAQSRENITKPLIKPPRLNKGDTVGLITPASGSFNPSAIAEGRELLEYLGFQVKLGKNIYKKHAYLGGTDAERAADLHDMFLDDQIRAIITLRGGYGCGRILEKLDYQLIQTHPKILIGYSDITSLHLGIHKLTGLVTFHGPVALSTFNDYSTKYFFKTLTESVPVGAIEDPPRESWRKKSDRLVIRPGIASGPLIGGNLTMVVATLGTPFEIDTRGKILFLEEVGEEPYDLDRMLTQLRLADKLRLAAGIVIDKCAKCGPSEYKPAFENSFSVEEVFYDRLQDLECPVLFGLDLGHVANKPTLPLGIQATLDTESARLRIDEAAVV
ncbi:LD-carboxypeptidase [candidate division KSB1 bacterium]|nr:LD-carboxypeptidase [candidate division KSB1 bacterium]